MPADDSQDTAPDELEFLTRRLESAREKTRRLMAEAEQLVAEANERQRRNDETP